MSTVSFLKNIRAALISIAGSLAAICIGLLLVAIFLVAVGRNPVETYIGIFTSAFGGSFAITETFVAATPIMLTALAVAIAGWVGLLNVGAEGQLYLGAIGATMIAITIPNAPSWQMIPAMFVVACLFGAVWSGVPAILRAKFGVNETIVTLLLNYVALLLVEFLIHGPWQDPSSSSWPQTMAFSDAAQLPHLFASRVHPGLFIGIVMAVFFAFLIPMTKPGFIIRVIGGNPKAAAYAHLPVVKYIIISMLVSGAIAAIAGFGQVSAIEGRLRSGISPGYGYTGFLVCWLARHNPLAIIIVSIFVGGLLSGADSLQLSTKLPFATVNIMQGTIFLTLLMFENIIQRFSSATVEAKTPEANI